MICRKVELFLIVGFRETYIFGHILITKMESLSRLIYPAYPLNIQYLTNLSRKLIKTTSYGKISIITKGEEIS